MSKNLKIISLIIVFVLLLGIVACGKTEDPVQAVKLVVYRARSSGMTVGPEDEKVEEAIENAFYRDTGKKIELQMQMYENDELPNKVDTGMPARKVQIDAIMHTISADDAGSAIMRYARANDGSVIELDKLLASKGKNIMRYIRMNDTDHLVERAGYTFTDGQLSNRIIPAVYDTKLFAILLRKDYWEKAFNSGKTTLDPEDYDVMNDNYKNLSVEEFEDVMKAVKQVVPGISYPLTGKSWDICRTIGSSFGADGFALGKDTDGRIIPPYCTAEYSEFVDFLYRWSHSGIWEIDSAQVNDDTRKSNFIAGKNAAFVSYPTPSELINLSRSLSNVDANAECMIIAPLAVTEKGEKTVRGYYEQPAAFEGIVIPAKSENAELMIEFLDWMFASPDNYEMTKYGIKGEHWVDGGDVTIGDQTFKTWAYPDGKIDQFMQKPPYSGCWNLLINTNISNRIRADYNTTEKNWYVRMTRQFEGYCNKSTVGINMPEAPMRFYSQTAQMSADYTDIMARAITGQLYNGKNPGEAIADLHDRVITDYADYIAWINECYNQMMAAFDEKFSE